jgi:integrase
VKALKLRTGTLKRKRPDGAVYREPVYKLDDRGGTSDKRWTFPRTPEGKARGEAKVEELLRARLLEQDQPLLNPMVDRDAILGPVTEHEDKTRTVGGYARAWLDHRGGRIRTRRSREDLFALHIGSFELGGGRTLGETKVRDITRGHVRLLVVSKREGKDGTPALAPNTCRLIFRVLDAMLATAVADGILIRHPVDRDLKRELRAHFRRDARQEKVKAFTEEHARHFLAVAREHSELYPLYATGFLAGLRLGELCGLQLDDDHDGIREGKRVRLLHVERQLGQECSMRDPHPGEVKHGVRDVDVARDLGKLFDTLKADRPKLAMARAWRPIPKWAFATCNGTPYSQRNVLRDFGRTLGLAGLTEQGYTPHSMRHAFATFHIARGRGPQWVKQQMGHSSIKVTFDLYGDWFRLHDQQAADEMGAALLGDGGNTAGNMGS